MITNIFLLTGTIIGAGIFSLPFVFKTIGIYLFILLTLLALVSIFLSLAYLEIIKKEKKRDQLPYYLKKYLGQNLSNLSTLLFTFSIIGALTGYLMLIKFTLSNFLFFLIPIYIILLLKRNLINEVDDTLTFFLLSIFIVLIYLNNRKTPFLDSLLTLSNIKLNLKNLANAYGAILFSFTGFSVLPNLNFKSHPKLSIIISYFIVTIIYGLFALTNFSEKTLLLNLAVIFAILTSYIPLTLVLEETLIKDLSINPLLSKISSLLLPLIFVLFGGKNFITAFSITGGIFIALLQTLIILAFLKIKGKNILVKIFSYITLFILLLGAVTVIFENV